MQTEQTQRAYLYSHVDAALPLNRQLVRHQWDKKPGLHDRSLQKALQPHAIPAYVTAHETYMRLASMFP